jgi:hypothetical protein
MDGRWLMGNGWWNRGTAGYTRRTGHPALQYLGDTTARTGGLEKSKKCKTNPSLFKPAWKFVPDKAKNEPKLDGSMGVYNAKKRVFLEQVGPAVGG